MSRPQTEQRRLQYRGREFHFVSFEGLPANPKRDRAATAPAWWLMNAGARWEVMPFHAGQDMKDLDRAFTAWLDAHVFNPRRQPEADMAKRGPQAAAKRKREGDKRAKREAKIERRAQRAAARAENREAPEAEPTREEEA